MYKAIIIDDEETVRSGLREHFDWAKHGVRVEAEFPDCAKAYDYIRENPVDLVVTVVYAAIFNDMSRALYGLVALYVTSLVMDKVVYGLNAAKAHRKISDLKNIFITHRRPPPNML